MIKILPPVCLLLAIAAAFGAFGLLAVESPEASVELHRARTVGNEAYTEVLEGQLASRQRNRRLLIGSLFALSAALAVTAFLAMRPAAQ